MLTAKALDVIIPLKTLAYVSMRSICHKCLHYRNYIGHQRDRMVKHNLNFNLFAICQHWKRKNQKNLFNENLKIQFLYLALVNE